MVKLLLFSVEPLLVAAFRLLNCRIAKLKHTGSKCQVLLYVAAVSDFGGIMDRVKTIMHAYIG